MEYVWIGILAIAYLIIWRIVLGNIGGVYWTPFVVEDWDDVEFRDIWVWLHELALIVLFIFSLIKFIQKWS